MAELVCFGCKFGPMNLNVELEDGREVIEGELKCPKCWSTHPIRKGVPNAWTRAQLAEAVPCLFCGNLVQPREAQEQWDWLERTVMEAPTGLKDPFEGFVETKPWHCIQNAIYAEYPKMARKLYLTLLIDRVARKRGISRRAASNWLRRQKFRLPSENG